MEATSSSGMPNPIQGGPFRHCSRMGIKKEPLPKICHTYPTTIKLGTVLPDLKKIQNLHKLRDAPFNFC